MKRLEQSSRVALAALLHDIGKITERARLSFSQADIDWAKQSYCPRSSNGFTHIHAAYTFLGVEQIAQYLPLFNNDDCYPFVKALGREADDSLINAAAMHHKPKTFLQWVVAEADRTASGFEREKFDLYNQAEEKNHYQARLLSLFELIDLTQEKLIDNTQIKYRYPLKPLSINAQFPRDKSKVEPQNTQKAQAEYKQLWENFQSSLKKIPEQLKARLPLWLEAFEGAILENWQAVPSATAFGARPDVSLFDHSKAVAAFATALWRYLTETQQAEKDMQAWVVKGRAFDKEPCYLIIQGDFFGIQNFIFNDEEVGNSQKEAAKLLRGRSFMVSLLTELAAGRVMEALSLPSTSQIINAAGKFMILAPNTEDARQKLKEVEAELNQWFIKNTYAQSGVGIVYKEACAEDFVAGRNQKNGRLGFAELMDELFDQLEQKKYQHFDLVGGAVPAVFDHYLSDVKKHGVCSINGHYPADGKKGYSKLVDLQIKLGALLAKPEKNYLLIYRDQLENDALGMDLLGFSVALETEQAVRDRLNRESEYPQLLRIFDMSIPSAPDETVFNGFAKRFIKGHMPIFRDQDLQEKNYKYAQLSDDELEQVKNGALKTLHHLAEDAKQPDEKYEWIGESALHVLKGDVDNLGLIFRKGLIKLRETGSQPTNGFYPRDMTFAKMASLSRQLNQFFTLYLPWLCAQKYPNTYTVFAGGDDFFLIGPWRQQIDLAMEMRQKFSNYCAHNPQVTFSVGLSLVKPKLPVRQLSNFAEQALDQAKDYQYGPNGSISKNALTLFGQTLSWDEMQETNKVYLQFKERVQQWPQLFSSGYVYGLLELCDMAAKSQMTDALKNPEVFGWRSKLFYRTHRILDRENVGRGVIEELLTLIANHLNTKPEGFKTVLYRYLYEKRK